METPETITKTVCQYNSAPVSPEDMKLLMEISKDYGTVKRIVYERYSGIRSLNKLYPGYTVQNEMTQSNVRQSIGIPSVYFYRALFDALSDIKAEWTRTKKSVLKSINKNEKLTDAEKHYLRFLIKWDSLFYEILNDKEITIDESIKEAYESITKELKNKKRLDNYLKRQVRKYHRTAEELSGKKVNKGTEQPENKTANKAAFQSPGFSITERAYRYADHGIYISTEIPRKRVFIPLTDNNTYKSQLYIKIYPDEGKVEIKVPVKRKTAWHDDYINETGIALGIKTMLTTDKGREYGKDFFTLQTEYADFIRNQSTVHSRNKDKGRKKYNVRKNRYTERLRSYINMELNRFIKEEKPETVYMVKLPKQTRKYGTGKINNTANMWQRGYIKQRLTQKCKEQSVRLIEVLGKDISNECNICGSTGIKENGIFRCPYCGYEAKEKENAARNVLNRGRKGQVVRK